MQNFGARHLPSGVVDEFAFRREADAAPELLKKSLIKAEADGDFKFEERNGVLNILFEETGGKFVLTPNTPSRQIWISALSTRFKLDWDGTAKKFVLCTDREVVAAAYGK